MKTKTIFLLSFISLLIMSANQLLAQQQSLPENRIRAKISVPILVNETNSVHILKGKGEDSQTQRDVIPWEITVWIIDASITSSNNSFVGNYENIIFEGSQEDVSFAGTFSSDRKTLLSLRINYQLNTASSYQDEHISSRFYLNDLKVFSADKPDKDGKFLYICNYDKDLSSVSVESYQSTQITKSSWQNNTIKRSLVWIDEEKIGWLPFGPSITVTSGPGEPSHDIAVKGNSKTYAGLVMEALAKTTNVKLYDRTDRANTARSFEASLNGLCLPEHVLLTKLTAENLKNPLPCETNITITEKDNVAKQTLESSFLIIGPKGKKELKYNLFYGETKEVTRYETVYTEPTYIEFNRTLFTQVDEIVAAVKQMR